MREFKIDQNKIFLTDDNNQEIAVITFYYESDDVIVVDHTFVNESLRGQGIAFELVQEVVKYARANKLKIIPVCPYVIKVLARSEEYQDILKKR